MTLFAVNRFNEADSCFDKAVNADPHNPVYWKYKGMVLSQLNHNADALKCLDNALELNPEDDAILVFRHTVIEALEKEEK